MYHVVSLQHIFRLLKYELVVLDSPELVKQYEELFQKEEKVSSWGCFIPWAAASHQLSLTSLASNYNIMAAGDKFNNNSNSHKDPGSAPHTLHRHRQPDNGRRKSFLLSRIFKKPKDQDNDSDSEDNSAPTEKEELSVTETKKIRQNKQTPAP